MAIIAPPSVVMVSPVAASMSTNAGMPSTLKSLLNFALRVSP
jgi:hypothetical protein